MDNREIDSEEKQEMTEGRRDMTNEGSSRIYLISTEHLSAKQVRQLYADAPGFERTDLSQLTDEIRGGEAIVQIVASLCEPELLLIDTVGLYAKRYSQFLILDILNHRQEAYRSTILVLEHELGEDDPGYIRPLNDILDRTEEASVDELLDLKYRLLPEIDEIDFSECTDCVIKDIIYDPDEYLVCDCAGIGEDRDSRTAVLSVATDQEGLAKYALASSEEARHVMEIHVVKERERKRLHAFFDRPDSEIEKEKHHILLDLKANQVLQMYRHKVPLDLEKLVRADLHVHTDRSDGVLSPREVLERAFCCNGLKQICFLDHNTIMPAEEMRKLAEDYRGRIQLISGSEVSCFYSAEDGRKIEVHIGALGVQSEDIVAFRGERMSFSEFLESNRPDEERYISETRQKLHCYGLDLPEVSELKAMYPQTASLSSTHVADYLFKSGQAGSYHEIYDKYVGKYGDRLAYVNSAKFSQYASMEEVCHVIESTGGVCVLSHPFKYRFTDSEFVEFINAFIKMTKRGAAIEALYRKYDADQQKKLIDLARSNGVHISSGSDFHGRFSNDSLLSPADLIACQCSGVPHVAYLLRDVLGEQLRLPRGSDD